MKIPYVNKAMTAALDHARESQTDYWNAMFELERITGIADIDGNQDLHNLEVSDLFRFSERQR
jgi:hypothetical protein